jgi:protein O-GlcNAc transferase
VYIISYSFRLIINKVKIYASFHVKKLNVEQSLLRADALLGKGQNIQAKKIYQLILSRFPNNNRARKALININNSKASKSHEEVILQVQIDKLVILYNQKQYSKVANQANKLTKKYSNSFLLWNILGVVNQHLGEFEKAEQNFFKVTKINPNYADAYNNLGFTFKEQGKLKEAVLYYRKALEKNPKYAEAHNNLGNALKDEGKLEDALISYDQAIRINPNYTDAHINIGIIFEEQYKLDLAMQKYVYLLSRNQYHPKIHYCIGNIFHKQNFLKKAKESFKKAIKYNPNFAEAYYNMGNILKKQHAIQMAKKYYAKALKINPQYVEAYINIGNILIIQGNLDGGLKCFNQAIKINPKILEPYNSMGRVLAKQKKINEAIEAYDQALKFNPNHEGVISRKLNLAQQISDWSVVQKSSYLIPSLGTTNQTVSPFLALALEDEPKRQKARSEIYAKTLFIEEKSKIFSIPSKKPKRIRIGYFSPDFKEHPVSYLIAKLIGIHSRKHFEVFGYSFGNNKDSKLRNRIIQSFDVFRDVKDMDDEEVISLAREDKIDIAIDLSGYTSGSRTMIFSHKAAPIQISYLGFPGTMGLSNIDYIIADKAVIPEQTEKYYTEKPIYLPNTFMPTDNTRKFSSKKLDKLSMGLPEKAFVFCCFNNTYKISSNEFDIWMRLLMKIDGSVLWLASTNNQSKINLKKEAKRKGIDPVRIIFAEKVSMDVHLSRYKLADLFLDTFIYNGHTTTTEALWAGLPVVTMQGRQFAARVAGSLLSAIELTELISKNTNEYEALIFKLATNSEYLNEIKNKLLKNITTTALFDSEAYTKNLEKGYQQAYERYFTGGKPIPISIESI